MIVGDVTYYYLKRNPPGEWKLSGSFDKGIPLESVARLGPYEAAVFRATNAHSRNNEILFGSMVPREAKRELILKMKKEKDI